MAKTMTMDPPRTGEGVLAPYPAALGQAPPAAAGASRVTTSTLRRMKGKERIVVLTAYDYPTARLLDESGVDVLLIGDSLGMAVLGYDSTIPVTMADVLHHTKAVARGTKRALVVADMPFLSFQISSEEALRNAGRLLQEGGAQAVKLEGGRRVANTVARLVEAGIPVMGHLGLTPQSVNQIGGYRVQGRGEQEATKLLEDAVALEQAGVFSIVLEMVPRELAEQITAEVKVPTIGIGAGTGCDGQVLVIHDLLGLYQGRQPRFVKRYADLGLEIRAAVEEYAREVRAGEFPGPEHSFGAERG